MAYNKGEWSEFYVFLKMLSEGGIYGADKDLNSIPELFFPLIEIIRRENNSEKKFKNNDPVIRIIDGITDKVLLELPKSEFTQKAQTLLKSIKTSDKTFDVPEISLFMNKIGCKKVKADSDGKSDIDVVLRDNKTLRNQRFGFSIKSRLGSPSTLFNAGKTTNFVYKVEGKLSATQINEINSIDTASKLKDRINKIQEYGCELKFDKVENETFNSNLQFIDTLFPKMMANILLEYYKSRKVSKVSDLVRQYIQNSSDNEVPANIYEYKMKAFLSNVALGMMAATPWDGKVEATGGYIIVKETGDLVCYHLYNKNEFDDYLYSNTQFETATSSRHNFGKIFSDNDGNNYIALNLQIRFIK